VQCLRSFALKRSGDLPTFHLAAMNEHFFRLQLEWSSGASSSGGRSDERQAISCTRGHSTPLLEVDVSVPPGFGQPSWHGGDHSFLAMLPGTATHGPAVANQHGSKSSSIGSREIGGVTFLSARSCARTLHRIPVGAGTGGHSGAE